MPSTRKEHWKTKVQVTQCFVHVIPARNGVARKRVSHTQIKGARPVFTTATVPVPLSLITPLRAVMPLPSTVSVRAIVLLELVIVPETVNVFAELFSQV